MKFDSVARPAQMCVAAALAFMSVPVGAQDAASGDRKLEVKGGQEAQLGVFANLNPSCTGMPAPQVAFPTAPTHGMIVVRMGLLKVPETAANCAGKPVPAMSVVYKAEADGGSKDTVRLELTMGPQTQKHGYQITIAK